MKVPVVERIMRANDVLADEVRQTLRENGIVALNIMGAPGSGKTSLIEQTIARLGETTVAVIEGDIATTLDADRLSKLGVQVVQINTGGSCHLDAGMVKMALAQMKLSTLDLLFIENVGNLVCPAEFDIGEYKKVLVSSVPEGHDKVQKYPLMFRLVDAVVLNKTDLMQHVDFDLGVFRSSLTDINSRAPLFEVSCKTADNLDSWVAWVRSQVTS
ncbi:MAG: hydrogenase nickel incorporation protein HypB [Armatimonadetes bacterium]|nr:hydrogenase nickel incorporation protein HypB [Armatimonadota bacterium]